MMLLTDKKKCPTIGMISPHQLAALVETFLDFSVFAPGEKFYIQGSLGKVLVKVIGYAIFVNKYEVNKYEAEVEYTVEPLESLRKIYPRTGIEREFDLMTVSVEELLPLPL